MTPEMIPVGCTHAMSAVDPSVRSNVSRRSIRAQQTPAQYGDENRQPC